MTLRVVHLVTSFDMGGLQNGIVNIVNKSDPSRVTHVILSMRDKLSLSERLRQGEVRSLDLDAGRHLFAFRVIARALREFRPDVLHTRNWGTYPDGVLAAVAAGVPIRVHGHHGRDIGNAAGENSRRRMIGRCLALMTHRFVALTPSMRDEYVRDFGVDPARIEIIPNGVDLDRLTGFAPDPALRSPFTVVSVGRLDPVKDFGTLIEAFGRMRCRGPGDRLWIAGEGPDRERLERRIADLSLGDSVGLLGERKDAPAVMKAADVYVQPSIYEGMSNTIVEAMAVGVPVIATRVGGNADVMGEDGTGVLVPPRDPASLARALDEMKLDEAARVRIGAKGRAHAIARYGLDTMTEAYTTLYERLAGVRAAAKAASG